jgi:hypothetical protein
MHHLPRLPLPTFVPRFRVLRFLSSLPIYTYTWMSGPHPFIVQISNVISTFPYSRGIGGSAVFQPRLYSRTRTHGPKNTREWCFLISPGYHDKALTRACDGCGFFVARLAYYVARRLKRHCGSTLGLVCRISGVNDSDECLVRLLALVCWFLYSSSSLPT